jgi:putative spermidine/putrescine transport system permease protein
MPTARRAGGRALLVILVLIIAGFILGPLIWLAAHAFATEWRYPNLLPSGLTLDWWRTVFADPGLFSSMRNSLFFAPVTVLVSAVVCLPAAYAFSRFDFPGRRFFLVGLFATNAFPKMGLFVSMATILHVIGTVVFMTWIPAAAFSAVPRSLEEAARDAGAGRIRVFLNVTLPMALPGILVAAVMSFLASFDEAQGTYLVGAPSYMTMPTEMYSLVLNYPTQVAAVFAILLSIPSVVLLLLTRKYIMGGQLAEGFQIR